MAKNIKASLIEAIESQSARSTWDRAVKDYAVDMVDGLEDGALEPVKTSEQLLALLLNGAEDWREYSYGGLALIYDADIAARVCTPSELRAKRGGELQPSRRENWLDVQARALGHAVRRIELAFEDVQKGAEK